VLLAYALSIYDISHIVNSFRRNV